MRIATMVMVLALLLAFGVVAYAQEPEDDPIFDDDDEDLDDDDSDDDDNDDENEEQSDGEEEMTSDEREANGDGLKRAHDEDTDMGGCGY